jgi:peroxidase
MHRNLVTAWIDGSQIYGSDSQTACSLRSFQNGKLEISIQGN